MKLFAYTCQSMLSAIVFALSGCSQVDSGEAEAFAEPGIKAYLDPQGNLTDVPPVEKAVELPPRDFRKFAVIDHGGGRQELNFNGGGKFASIAILDKNGNLSTDCLPERAAKERLEAMILHSEVAQ